MKKGLAALAALVVLATLIAIFLRELYRPYQGYRGNVMVVIEPRMRAPAVAELLVARGVLARRWPFLLRYALGRQWNRLKAGEYFFDHPIAPIDVYRKLIRGEVFLHAVVVPEGFDRFDIARIVHEQLGIPPEEFLAAAAQPFSIRDLDSRAPSLEGYLFPDTYRFPRGVDARTVAGAMVARFRRVLESKLHEDLARSPRDLHGVVTLASLVEKETSDPAERSIIAGVFERRLRRGWPIQCDPTVIYAQRLNHHFLERPLGPILQRDLNYDSPYNTYRHAGLPPGPIASPGEASLRAAFNPAPGDLLYFVSNNHGGHIFARTLAEHRRNVARYQREVAALRRVARQKSQSSERASSKKRREGSGATPSSAKSAELKN